MKKAAMIPIALTAAFLCILIGVFIGRSQREQPLPLPEDFPLQEETGANAQGKIDINTADIQQLMLLPGIGEELAGRILKYRQKFGPFLSVDGLKDVDGIGDKKMEQIRPYLTVGGKPNENISRR